MNLFDPEFEEASKKPTTVVMGPTSGTGGTFLFRSPFCRNHQHRKCLATVCECECHSNDDMERFAAMTGDPWAI